MRFHQAQKGFFYLQTFGCQMNVHDSDRMQEILSSAGWQATNEIQRADLVLFNTCSVREKAEQKLRSEVGKLAVLKEERPALLIAVAGCVAQQEGTRLLKRIPLIDLVIGPDNLQELPALLDQQIGGAPPVSKTVFDVENPHFLQAQPLPGQAPVSAFVTTMKGCDERCSFCIVPYTRGTERYRPVSEIIQEIKTLVTHGTKEVTLLGQTVDSYRDPSLPPPESDDPDESQFPALLRLIAKEVPELWRLRYTSPHPRHATESLARAHADLDILAKHIHLPVQSGSNRILKKMIRRYKREEYIARAERLKATRPGLTLSTDIIVGFPGETEDDFQETLSLVQQMGFVSLFGFRYSVRPYTPAKKMENDVPEEIKSDRLHRLLALGDEITYKHLQSLEGTIASVLVEGASKHGNIKKNENPNIHFEQGRTDRNEVVHFSCPTGFSLIGEQVFVQITQANKRSLSGELLPLSEGKLRAIPTAVRSAKRISLPLAVSP